MKIKTLIENKDIANFVVCCSHELCRGSDPKKPDTLNVYDGLSQVTGSEVEGIVHTKHYA